MADGRWGGAHEGSAGRPHVWRQRLRHARHATNMWPAPGPELPSRWTTWRSEGAGWLCQAQMPAAGAARAGPAGLLPATATFHQGLAGAPYPYASQLAGTAGQLCHATGRVVEAGCQEQSCRNAARRAQHARWSESNSTMVVFDSCSGARPHYRHPPGGGGGCARYICCCCCCGGCCPHPCGGGGIGCCHAWCGGGGACCCIMGGGCCCCKGGGKGGCAAAGCGLACCSCCRRPMSGIQKARALQADAHSILRGENCGSTTSKGAEGRFRPGNVGACPACMGLLRMACARKATPGGDCTEPAHKQASSGRAAALTLRQAGTPAWSLHFATSLPSCAGPNRHGAYMN